MKKIDIVNRHNKPDTTVADGKQSHRKTRSALGRALVPPTKVFRRLSRVDYCNAVVAVSRRCY